MTDNQFNQLFGLVTKSVNGIQKLEQDFSEMKKDIFEIKQDVAVLKQDVAVLKEDVAVLKQDVAVLKEDVSELKAGQGRLESEIQTTNRAFDALAGESIRVRARVEILERKELPV